MWRQGQGEREKMGGCSTKVYEYHYHNQVSADNAESALRNETQKNTAKLEVLIGFRFDMSAFTCIFPIYFCGNSHIGPHCNIVSNQERVIFLILIS
jgi:hypothetical protein